MAGELFKLVGTIAIDNRDAIKNIEGVAGAAEKADKSIGSRFQSIGKNVKKVAVGIGAGAVAAGGALMKLGFDSAATADNIDKHSQKIGISTDSYQKWDYMLGQAGASVDALNPAMKKITKSSVALSNGGEKATEAYGALGLTWDDMKDMSPEAQLDAVMEGLMKIEDPAERNRVGMELLGGAYQELSPYLNQNAEEVKALEKHYDELGITMSEDQVKAGADMTDAWDDVQRSMGAIVTQIGIKVVPIMTKMMKWVVSNMPTIKKVFSDVFKVVGAVVTTATDIFKTHFLPVIEWVVDWVKDNFPAIKKTIGNVFDGIIGFVKVFVDLFTTIWDKYGDTIMKVIKVAWDFIKVYVEQAINTIKGIIAIVTGIIQGDWAKVWGAVKKMFSDTWENMKKIASILLNALKDVIVKIAQNIKKQTIDKFIELKDGAIAKIKEMKEKIVSWFSKLYTDGVQKIEDIKKAVVDRIISMKDSAIAGVKRMKEDVVTWFDNMKTDANQKVTDMVDWVKAMPGKMAQGIRDGAGALRRSFVDMWNGVTTAVAKPVNAVIGGANWILGKFGATKMVGTWTPKQYAKGTDGHLGGPALVNDGKGANYREAIQTPDGNTFVPKGRNVLFPNMPKGTKVLDGAKTKSMSMYSKGVGVWDTIKGGASKAWSGLKKGASSVWDFLKKPGELISGMISDRVSYDGISLAKDLGKGAIGKAKSGMVEWAKGLFTKHDNPADQDAGGQGSSVMGGIGFPRPPFRKTSSFGYRTHPIFRTKKLHTGVDMAAPTGTNVFAQNAGKVVSAGYSGGFGKMVKIKSGITEWLYAHLNKIVAKRGSSVAKGNLIGKVGSTGNSTGPHLHFEKRVNGRPVHPGYQDGTTNAKGGWSWVGEEGPELLKLKGGESIKSNAESIRLAGDTAVVETLTEILDAIKKGQVITLDGRQVGKSLAGTMDYQMKTNSTEDRIGRGEVAW